MISLTVPFSEGALDEPGQQTCRQGCLVLECSCFSDLLGADWKEFVHENCPQILSVGIKVYRFGHNFLGLDPFSTG